MTLSFRAQAAFTKLNYQPFYRDCMETTETNGFHFFSSLAGLICLIIIIYFFKKTAL